MERTKRLVSIVLIGVLFSMYPLHHGYAGWGSSSEKAYHTFRYEVTGEIEVKPTLALFPITISTNAQTYHTSLEKAQQIVTQLERDVKQGDSAHFSLAPADFEKASAYTRSSVSFFGGDNTPSKTRLAFFLRLHFVDDDTFWERANRLAQALDILQTYTNQYQEDDVVDFVYGELLLHIDDKEQYREQIVTSVYLKAKKVVDVIATYEHTTPKIKEMNFNQTIQEEMLNLHKASLSLKATLVFEFEEGEGERGTEHEE